MYGRRNPPAEPPCKTCRVDLLEDNEEVAFIYLLVRRQVVTVGMGKAVDISIPALKVAMDLYGVRDQKACLNRVRTVFHHFMKEQDNESR